MNNELVELKKNVDDLSAQLDEARLLSWDAAFEQDVDLLTKRQSEHDSLLDQYEIVYHEYKRKLAELAERNKFNSQ